MSEFMKDWMVSIAILVATMLAAGLLRIVLRRLRRTRYAGLIAGLAAPISNLVLVVGAGAAVNTAPLHPKLSLWLSDATYVISVAIATFLVRRATFLAMEWGAHHSPRAGALQHGFIPLMKNVVTLFVFFTAAIFVLKRFGQDVMSLLTALGVGSLAVGLAAKDTLANMIAGFTLVIDRNLHPGDRVNMGGIVGTVEEIGLRSTRINTADGNVLIVPNSELVNTKILNLSLPTVEGTTSGELRVAYHVPFQDVRNHCLAAMTENDRITKDRSPWVNLKSLSDGHQLIQFGFWVHDAGEAGGVLSQVQEKILGRLQAARIPLEPPTPAPRGPSG